MDELDRGLAISMRGRSAREALASFHRQASAWGIALPKVQPLVLDFGLGDYARTGLIELWIANEARFGYCGKYLYVAAGQSCPEHCHRVKHETFFVVKGSVLIRSGGRSRRMGEGGVLAVGPGVRHSFTGLGACLLLELSTPCEVSDNRFTDARIPIGRPRVVRGGRGAGRRGTRAPKGL